MSRNRVTLAAVVGYVTPAPAACRKRQLVAGGGKREQSFPFYDQLEIRRCQPGMAPPPPGTIFLDDGTVSSRHCIVTQSPDGRCFVRDVSRNGTLLDGRRLIPNVETEFCVGQVVSVGIGYEFRLEGDGEDTRTQPRIGSTLVNEDVVTVTVLVGDIKGFTHLVRTVERNALQQSISRVFEILEAEVNRLGGAIKEYPGDAIFAFWEERKNKDPALRASQAALELDRLVRELAEDKSVWKVSGHCLRMEWALATGDVTIQSMGGAHPTGLSMIGEPVVLAFRLEKLVGDETGPILACPETARRAGAAFAFDDMGEAMLDGFDQPCRVFALRGENPARP
jgi:class 3 adenylate cyclase